MSSSPLVTAVVLNYRSSKDTVRAVRALHEQTVADRMEIFAVDNHSDDESIGFMRAQLSNLPNVRIIEEPENLGYGKGNNAAVKLAKGEYILILNPDNVLPKDGVEKMLDVFKTHPDAGIVGPALVHPDGTIRPSARRFPTPWNLVRKRFFPEQWQKEFDRESKRLHEKDIVEVDWIAGACLLLSADLYEKLGGFDERFFLFFEDIDLCRRVHAMGKKVLYVSSIRVLDRKGRLSDGSIFSLLTKKTMRVHFVSGIKYFWKWGF